jgi:hypothetical protein
VLHHNHYLKTVYNIKSKSHPIDAIAAEIPLTTVFEAELDELIH